MNPVVRDGKNSGEEECGIFAVVKVWGVRVGKDGNGPHPTSSGGTGRGPWDVTEE